MKRYMMIILHEVLSLNGESEKPQVEAASL